MLSVILYGRNDTYGYNLHKRAAISLNCIAEVLTDTADEIIFVDCNSPDDMPTFPEAIQDTLTPKARELLRILRLRPQQYETYKRGSPLKALEPLSRNIAIRRSNPANRWILSTNTDMVFVVREPGKSLSDLVAELPDEFYELPRFEVPEALWETLNRTDPTSTIERLRQWGQRLHLNEAVLASPVNRFDGPGDFQLMLREQISAIHGFNEEMVWGWHADSNLCKRLFLLNGSTQSLLDKLLGYHCCHTRVYSFLHSEHRTENDPDRFYHDVAAPYLPEQADTWGIPHEQIEEIRLTEEHCLRFGAVLADLLPVPSEPISTDVFVSESFNHGQLYNIHHVFPFLCNYLNDIPTSAVIGYCGANVELLCLLSGFLERRRQRGELLVDEELFATAKAGLLPGCTLVSRKEFIVRSDLFIFDVGLMHLPRIEDSNDIAYPAPTEEAEVFRGKLRDAFYLCAGCEAQRLKFTETSPREFILVSSQHTWMEAVSAEVITPVLTPYSSHVRYGYLKDSSRLLSLPFIPELYAPASPTEESLKEFLKRNVSEGEKIAAPAELGRLFPGAVYPLSETMPRDMEVDWAVMPTEAADGVDPWFREHALEKMTPVFVAGEHTVFSKVNVGSPASLLSLVEGALPPSMSSEPLIV